MAQYLVLESAYAAVRPGVVQQFDAGAIIDDGQYDVSALAAQGVALVVYNAGTMGDPLEAFRKQAGLPDRTGLLSALLLAAGAIGGGGGGGAVSSVFGRVGAVVAALNDYTASLVGNTSGVPGATVAAALDALAAAIPSVPVASVFGRTGAVIAMAGDYAAALVTADDSPWSVLVGTTVQAALNAADTALLNLRTTGVRFGGEVTVNGGDPADVDIEAGAGAILDNTTPSAPTYSAVTWSAAAGLSPPAGVSWYYVDSSGTIQNTTSAPTNSQRRTRVYLARVSVTGGVVSGITSIVTPTQQLGSNLRDLQDALGLIRESGTIVQPATVGTALELELVAGRLLTPGANFHNDATDPNGTTIVGGDPYTFRMATQNGAIAVDETELPVGFYDAAGTVTATPGAATRANIFELRLFPNGNLRIFYDQEPFYASIADAQQALGTRSLIVPAAFDQAFTVGWIIATKGATDLSDPNDALFISSNRFGGIGGGTAGVVTGVTSVNGDPGPAVVLDSDDIGNASGVTGATVSAALDTLAAAGGADPLAAYDAVSDFLSSVVSGNLRAGEPWSLDTDAGGIVRQVASESGHPGIVELDIDSAGGGRASVILGTGPDAFTNGVIFGDGETRFEAVLRVDTPATVSEDYYLIAGFGTSPGDSAPDPGIHFAYNRGAFGGNWQAITRDGSDTVTDTGIAVAAATWVKLTIVVNAAGTSVAFFIDDVLEATHTTNVAGGTPIHDVTIARIAGTTARTVQVDLARGAKTLTSSR